MVASGYRDKNMKFLSCLVMLLLVGGLSSAQAAETGIWRKPVPPATVYRVIPRSPEAALVWAGDACWRNCAMDCGRHYQACLSVDAQPNCTAQNDACDRFCQRGCRLYGGPLLPLD
jgi:hypothetical protein